MRQAPVAVLEGGQADAVGASARRLPVAARWAPALADAVFGIDARSLAALRVCLGLLLLRDLCGRAQNLVGHYSDLGILPRDAVLEKLLTAKWCVCLHLVSGAAEIQALLFLVAAGFAVCLVAGYRTRLATACSWYLLLSLHDRNPLILQGGDALLRMMLFWGMFLPLGERWSVDALQGRNAGKPRVVSVAGAALLLQVAFVYWFSALLKTGDPWTKDYSALYYALSLDAFVTHPGKLLLHYPALLRGLTFSAVWWERLGPVLAFAPGRGRLGFVRLFAALGFMGFHLMMAVCLNLGLFPAICCAAWIVFLPACFWDNIPARRRALPEGLRERWARAAAWLAAGGRPRVRPAFNAESGAVQGLAGVFLVYVLLWNVRTVAPARVETIFPDGVNWLAQLTRVDQMWDMFSPSPLREGGWFVMPAQLRDGTQVDVFRGGAPVDWAKPRHIADDFKDDRWRKYMVVMAEAKNSDIRVHYCRYLCYDWDEHHPANKAIRSLQMYLMMQLTLPDYQPSKAQPMLLYNYVPAR